MYLQRLRHTGGWNTDDDVLNFPPQDWRSASYVRPMNMAAGFSGQPDLISSQGNSFYNNSGLAAGTNVIIGFADWSEEQSFLVFFWNSNDDHSIWRYHYDNATTPDLVVEDSVLNFQLNLKIFNAKVVDGVVKWTDGYFDSFLITAGIVGYNPPRELDVQKALDSDYSAITFQLLDVIKWPPWNGPAVTYETDTTIGSNKLYGFLYQFRYQYVYDTGAVSVYSPISELPLPNLSEFISGRNYLDPSADNRIAVTVETGPEYVTKIRVAVRRGNDEQFYVFKELDKALDGIADNTTYDVDWYGTAALKSLPLGLQNSDSVPQVALRQEVIPLRENSVAMSYHNYYEGYDKVEPDVTLAYTITGLDDKKNRQNNFQFSEVSAGASTTIEFNADDPNICYAVEGDVFSFSFNDGGTLVTVVYTVSAADITAINALGTENLKLAYLITAVGDYCATELGTTGAYGLLTYTLVGGYTGLADGVLLYAYTNRPTNPVRTLKTGFNWPFGIQYYDRGLRDSTVIPIGEIYIDFPSEQDTSTLTDPNDPYSVQARLSIDHIPPEYADTYQIVTQIPYIGYMQRSVQRIQADGANRIKVSLEDFYLTSYGANTNNGLEGGATYNYVPQRGDIMRFIRQQVDTGTSDNAPYCTEYVEVQVMQYSPSEGEGNSECVWVNYFDAPSLLGGIQAYGGFVVEIYRPFPASDSRPWMEISEEYDVLNPHTATRSHAGNIQNQVNGGVPAILELAYGDSYLRPRNMGTKFDDATSQYACWWVECNSYSDYYQSDVDSRGRIAVESSESKRKKFFASGRHSKSGIEETGINGLNTFTFEDKYTLSEADGEISGAIMVGQTLKVLQAYQETSVYIQQAYSITPDGTGQTAFVSEVFGGINRMESNYGCDLGGLICQYEGVLYYYDRRYASLIASTQGGQVNLCEGEFKFRKGGDSIKTLIDPYIFTSGDFEECIMAVNPLQKEIQLWAGGTATGDFFSTCYTFSLSRKRWICNMDHAIRFCFNIGQNFYSTTGEDLYVDLVSSGNMEFNGIDPTTKTVNLTVVDAVRSDLVKVPMNATLWQNAAPNTFTVAANRPTMPTIQPSAQILEGAFAFVEGKYVGVLSKDTTDPAFTDGALAAISGRDLRGNSFDIFVSYTVDTSLTPYRFYGISLNQRISSPMP